MVVATWGVGWLRDPEAGFAVLAFFEVFFFVFFLAGIGLLETS